MAFSETYTDTPEYYQMICEKILAFARALPCESSQILGIGFAMQALISADKKSILYGKILSCTGLSLSVFSDHLPWPCSFIHDAESAAVSELWASLDLTDAFYLSLSRHLGGSVIAKRTILGGKHGHSGTIEHIHMRDNGIRCYCGQIGCMETLCSVKTLLADGETLESFFTNVRQGNVICSCRWAAFLSDLAECINLLHLVYDTDFILGGHLAPYLQEEDLLFPADRVPDGHPICRKKISFFCTKKSASSHHLGNRRTFSASVKCRRIIFVSERRCHIFRGFGGDVLLLHRPHHPVKCVDSADSIIIRLRILV